MKVGSHGADDIYSEQYVPPYRDPVILREQVLLQLKKIIDPDLYQDIVSLGFVKELCLDYDNGKVTFTLELTTPACPVKEDFVAQADHLLKELGWVTDVQITLTSRKAQPLPGSGNENLSGVSVILCVASCKGGVGKSSIAVNLAFTLSRLGAAVGLVDADVYGPSLPHLIPFPEADVMFHSFEAEAAEAARAKAVDATAVQYENTEQAGAATDASNVKKRHFVATGKGALVPLVYKGVKLMSAGYLRSTAEYAAIRGPLASGLAYQLVSNTLWGDLDYLIVDMPPGTGDVHLTLSQGVKMTAALMVTTPQQLSLADVEKGIHMYTKLNIPTLAVVENMSYFECPKCKIHYEIFNHNTSMCGEQTNTNDATATDQYSNIKRLLDQFGILHHIVLPLHHDLARVRFSTARVGEVLDDSASYLYPFALAFDESHSVWKQVKEMAQLIVREVASLKFAGDRSPDVSTTSDGMLQLVLKEKSAWAGVERILHVPLRYVRLACRCAECMDEFTGKSKLQSRKVPVDIYIKTMQQTGTYAVSIDWSDEHHSLMSFSLLEKLCNTYDTQRGSKSGKRVLACEEAEQLEW